MEGIALAIGLQRKWVGRDDGVVKSEASALERAINVACRAHRGQLYPSPDGEPFILHPLRVMPGRE